MSVGGDVGYKGVRVVINKLRNGLSWDTIGRYSGPARVTLFVGHGPEVAMGDSWMLWVGMDSSREVSGPLVN